MRFSGTERANSARAAIADAADFQVGDRTDSKATPYALMASSKLFTAISASEGTANRSALLKPCKRAAMLPACASPCSFRTKPHALVARREEAAEV